MTRSFPQVLVWIGIPFAILSTSLAVRLLWEQTIWTWEKGLQMVGNSLVNGGGFTLFFILVAGVLWAIIYVVIAIRRRSCGGTLGITVLFLFVLGFTITAIPYTFWQNLFIDRLVKSPHAYQFMESAAVSGDLEMMERLLENGMPINIRNSRGETALHGAAMGGHVDIVKLLLIKGIAVNVTNAEGDSALFIAEVLDHINIVKLLEENGGKRIRGTKK